MYSCNDFLSFLAFYCNRRQNNIARLFYTCGWVTYLLNISYFSLTQNLMTTLCHFIIYGRSVRERDPAGTDTGCEAVLVGGTQCPQPAATQKFSHKK